VKIEVDHALCQGHGQCEDAAPSVFEVRADGLAYVLGAETQDADLTARVVDAQRRCPVDAILLSDRSR
jgi:ferredoxin